MLEELKNNNLNTESSDIEQTESTYNEKLWGVETLEEIEKIEPSQFHPERKWMPTHFKIERPDGITEEIESTKTVLTIISKDGTKIDVPAYAAHHIMSLHLKGEEAGSVLSGGSLEESFRVLANHLPKEIPFKNNSAAFEVDVKQPTGSEGVSSQKEMIEKNVATEKDLEMLSTAKDEVFRLNIEGSDSDKEAFVNDFNAKMSGNVKLGIRGGSITPFFTAEKQPTSKMFIVIGSRTDEDGNQKNSVVTMSPGRYMDKLPTDGRFTGKIPTEGIPEGTTVADLWKKIRSGATLTKQEVALVDNQKTAQECWWNGGFIVSP